MKMRLKNLTRLAKFVDCKRYHIILLAQENSIIPLKHILLDALSFHPTIHMCCFDLLILSVMKAAWGLFTELCTVSQKLH